MRQRKRPKNSSTILQYLYETGQESYVEMLLTSESVADLVNKVDYAEELQEYDRRLLDEYKAAKQAVIDLQAQLEEEKQELLREAAGYASLAEQNPDYVGWLKIPGTRIDYPVMSRASDPEYYLHRAFDGSRSSGGTPFLGQLSDKDSTCMIVYGHNMKNGSMFGTLDDYKSEKWQTEHPVIEFFVDGEVREYEVFAAAESRVLYEDEEGFRYYRSGGDLSEEEYGKLITWLQENSDYETGIIPEYGEQILMLSTCSYHTKDGRFVVAARRISEP